MANICTFEGYVKGPQADVKRFKEAMEEAYNYQLTKEAAEKIKTWVNEDSNFSDTTLYDYINRPDYGQKVKDLLKDPRSYIHYPEHPHFYRVSDISFFNETPTYAEFFGSCAWSVATAMTLDGYHSQSKDTFRNGTCLEDFPMLTFEIISTEPGLQFTEHAKMEDGIFSIDCEDYSEYWFSDYEEYLEYDLPHLNLKREDIEEFDCFYESDAPWLEIDTTKSSVVPIYDLQP